MSTQISNLIVENALTVRGPAGEMRLTSDIDGLWNCLARKTKNTPSGLSYVSLDDPIPGHYCEWGPDWGQNGDFIAFYDNQLDQDMMGIFVRGPYRGRFQLGVETGPPVRLNNREITAELDLLKAQVAQLQDQLSKLLTPPPVH